MMLTVKDVAAALNLSPTCVYQLVGTGKLPCHRLGVGRGAIRIDESDLAAFLESSRSQKPSSPPTSKRVTGHQMFKHLRLRKS
jgi:excisionase family DNA binding protein